MKNIFLAVLIYLICTASSCEKFIPDRVSRFWIQNNSSGEISFSYSLRFPDSSISHLQRFEVITISNGEKAPIDSRKDWDKVINEDIPGKKLQIFVFTIPVNDNNWDSVKNNYLVQKRFELAVDDLNTINWVVSYP